MTTVSIHEREAAFAARWRAGEWRGQSLRAESGEQYIVVYQGRPGGGAGPDFRDAVLARPDGSHVYGDIELHLRPAFWRAHGHEHDPRYNGLALHIALAPPHAHETTTRLSSGRTVPLVVLRPTPRPLPPLSAWPCTGLAHRLSSDDLRSLLVTAGLTRFRRRAAYSAGSLAEEEPTAPLADRLPAWSAADRVLLVALAEALAYGRDREALRDAGARLAAGIPAEEVARLERDVPRVEGQRLRGLLAWHARWRDTGPWAPLRAVLQGEVSERAGERLVATLRVSGGLVSPGRARIVAVNVVLPFAAAFGARYGEPTLSAWAEAVYLALPGLPSNALTRLMARQLGLGRLPRGAVAQQGLQQLWAAACREKRCASCPCGAVSGRVSGDVPPYEAM